MSTVEHDRATVNEPEVTVERIEGDVMAVNSYLVHCPAGLVVVDAQLTVSDAAKVRQAVEATGLPLAGVIVTHPHPDHYAGAAVVAGDAPVLATVAVDTIIRRDDKLKSTVVGPMMGEEWPRARRFPDRLVEPGHPVELGGLTWQVTEYGPGESHVDTVWAFDDRSIFAGDIAYNDMHSYLADGHYASWRENLTSLETRLADDAKLYVGHGAPTGKAVLAAQRRYLDNFLTAVLETATGSAAERDRDVVDRMRTLTVDQRLSFLMELSIGPIRELLSSAGRS